MVDSLRHQRAGTVPQADVNDFGRARDHRGSFDFDRQITAGVPGRQNLPPVMQLCFEQWENAPLCPTASPHLLALRN